MRTRLLFLLLLVALLALFCNVKFGHADCTFGCLFQPGTKCVDNNCVSVDAIPAPTPTPAPAPAVNPSAIKIDSKPQVEIVAVKIDCSKMDLGKLQVYLARRVPAPMASYYSSIFYFYNDMQGASKVDYWFARKDLLNRYSFLYTDTTKEVLRPQSQGADFVFNVWENPAFNEFIKSKTCEELKVSGLFFSYGISIKGDCSDYEGAIFYFQ